MIKVVGHTYLRIWGRRGLTLQYLLLLTSTVVQFPLLDNTKSLAKHASQATAVVFFSPRQTLAQRGKEFRIPLKDFHATL
jgi:hypothetical protein